MLLMQVQLFCHFNGSVCLGPCLAGAFCKHASRARIYVHTYCILRFTWSAHGSGEPFALPHARDGGFRMLVTMFCFFFLKKKNGFYKPGSHALYKAIELDSKSRF